MTNEATITNVQEFIDYWIAELESGKYVQIFGRYSDADNGRCAVGVITDSFKPYYMRSAIVSSVEIEDCFEANLSNVISVVLNLNDVSHYSFTLISEFLRGNLMAKYDQMNMRYVLVPVDKGSD